MILDQKDGECLKLVGLCRYLPVTLKNKYTNEALKNAVTNSLREKGLIKLTGDEKCYRLTSLGRGALQEMGFRFREEPRSVLAEKERYERRRMCADINVMFHTAGINVFAEQTAQLDLPGYLPLLNVRSDESGAAVSGAHMAGLFFSGEIAYMVFYMSSPKEGAHVSFEEDIAAQLTRKLNRVKHTKIIFAGKSLEELWKLIFETKTKERLRNQMTPFAFAYEKFTYNILFLERTRYGAMQAQILTADNYRKRLADYYCKGKTNLPVTVSHCDGFYKNAPFIIAVDMDIKRLKAALTQAEQYNCGSPAILCLDFQERLLNQFLNYYQVQAVEIFTPTFAEVAARLPEIAARPLTDEPVRNKRGGCIRVK